MRSKQLGRVLQPLDAWENVQTANVGRFQQHFLNPDVLLEMVRQAIFRIEPKICANLWVAQIEIDQNDLLIGFMRQANGKIDCRQSLTRARPRR